MFANVAEDGRLATTGGESTFQINYGSGENADALVIGNFMTSPVPEPGTWALVELGGVLLLGATRRRIRRADS